MSETQQHRKLLCHPYLWQSEKVCELWEKIFSRLYSALNKINDGYYGRNSICVQYQGGLEKMKLVFLMSDLIIVD